MHVQQDMDHQGGGARRANYEGGPYAGPLPSDYLVHFKASLLRAEDRGKREWKFLREVTFQHKRRLYI